MKNINSSHNNKPPEKSRPKYKRVNENSLQQVDERTQDNFPVYNKLDKRTQDNFPVYNKLDKGTHIYIYREMIT